MQDNKVWYNIKNNKSYEHLAGVNLLSSDTLCSYENTVQASIDSFNSNVDWDDMWNLEEAKERCNKGHILFIGVDKDGPLAHVWFDKDYLYNMYVNPRRPDGYGVKFVQFCIQFIPYEYINLYCDDWNIRAQKFFEKVGFLKN